MNGENMTKDEARALIREKKKALTAEYRAEASAEIATRFLCYPIFQQVDSIFCYVNTEDEPSTREIIETAWQMGKLVTVPRCIPGPEHRMEAVQIMSWDDLVPGTYGLLEPKAGLPVVDAYKIALAVVPCIAADRYGRRLGHGAGYYDRFLQGQTMYMYCLCYGAQMLPEVPVDAQDVTMNRVFSEDKVYNPRLASDDLREELAAELPTGGIRAFLKGLFHRK